MSVVLKSVSKNYGKQKALNEISFEVSKGEILGLLGPNGSGKSTLMRIICSYIPANSGEVFVCGMDVRKDPLKTKAKIGYLPELNPLYPEMYVWEYLEFVAGLQPLKQKRKDRVAELIALMGLRQEQSKKIGQLSKGYKQRVGLAQALMHDPEVLILDEPTTGLDPNQLKDVRALIRTIGKNKTVIFSTHIMQEVKAICDRVLILKEGKIVADKKLSEINKELYSAHSIHVEFDVEIAKEELLSIEGVDAVRLIDNSWLLESSSAIDIRQNVFKFAVDKNVHVLSMNKVEKSLEEAFGELTKN